jgi:hypothetical protein
MKRVRLLLPALLTLGVVCLCSADNPVPLSLISSAQALHVTLSAGSDRALVRESCSLLLPVGRSEVRFRWTDEQIDAASLDLRGPAEVKIGGLRQPVGETNTYAWPVECPTAGARDFTISYFLKGLTWTPTYRLTLSADGQTASLTGRIHLTNDSKLALRNASLDLCVAPTVALSQDTDVAREGTYSIADSAEILPGWQRRFVFVSLQDLPASTLFRADTDAFKQDVHRLLLLDLRNLPGAGILPKGHVEIDQIRDDVRAWIGADDLEQQSDKPTELDLGVERNVVFERKTLSRSKTSLEMDKTGRVSGYDIIEETSALFRNHLDTAATVELVEKTPGKAVITGKLAPTSKNGNESRWTLTVEPQTESEVRFTYTRKIGTRAD